MGVILRRNTLGSLPVSSASTLFPSAKWNGTAGSGEEASPPSSTPRGSGFTQTAIAAFDEPPFGYLTESKTISVAAGTGDVEPIESVEFVCEGNSVVVTKVTLNARTGTIGWECKLDFKSFARDGDALVYAYIKPKNGYERRIGPIQLTAVGTGTAPITRAVRYLSPTGNNASAGTSPATAWKTFSYACSTAPNGAIIYMAKGTYLDDVVTTLVKVTRPLEFRPAEGVTKSEIILTRTSRYAPAAIWNIRATKVIFREITLDTGKMGKIQGGGWATNAPSAMIFQSCDIIDSNGILPELGYIEGIDNLGLFLIEPGMTVSLLECKVELYSPTGVTLMRNCTVRFSGDSVTMQSYKMSGMAIFNVDSESVGAFRNRQHHASELEVKTAEYNSGTGQTTIVWAPGAEMINASGSTFQATFRSGALDSSTFTVVTQTAATNTTIVVGDASKAVAGDKGWVWTFLHADAMQLFGSLVNYENIENIVFQNYKCVGDSIQPFFFQAGEFVGPGTISTTGTKLTCTTAHALVQGDFVHLTNGIQQYEYRRVASVESTTEATLVSAFAANQSAVNWGHGKTLKDLLLQNVILHHRATTAETAQLQQGHRHVVFENVTQPGFNAAAFRPKAIAFGMEDVVFRNSIFKQINGEVGVPFPTVGLSIDRMHTEVKSVIDAKTTRGTNPGFGPVTYDEDYVPTTGVTLTCTPRLPWNYAKEARKMDGSDLVGAM